MAKIFESIRDLVAAYRVLNQNAKADLILVRVENTQKVLKTHGIDVTGIEALTLAHKLKAI